MGRRAKGIGGFLVAVEGIDGAGSTTQTRALSAGLAALGYDVLATREPSDGPVGCYLREILRGFTYHAAGPRTVALLFAADRRDHLDREILPALAAGRVVVTDRYLMSSLAYQGSELGDLDWVQSINREVPRADLTFLLDLPAATAAARRAGRGKPEVYENDAFQQQVVLAYRKLPRHNELQILNGLLPADRLSEMMIETVLRELKKQKASR